MRRSQREELEHNIQYAMKRARHYNIPFDEAKLRTAAGLDSWWKRHLDGLMVVGLLLTVVVGVLIAMWLRRHGLELRI